jgi:hypothetical protein
MLLVIKRLSLLAMQMYTFLFVITIYLPWVGHIPLPSSSFVFQYTLQVSLLYTNSCIVMFLRLNITFLPSNVIN